LEYSIFWWKMRGPTSSRTQVFEVILSVFTLQNRGPLTTQHQWPSVASIIQWFQGIIWLLTTPFLPDDIKATSHDSAYYSIMKCNWHESNKTDNKYQLSLYIEGVYNAPSLLNNRILLNMSILWRCPACADFMSASVRAVYHHNDFESDAAAYIIEISIKIWVRQLLEYVDLVVSSPIVPWFAVGFVMVEVFFVSVWCVMAEHRRRSMSILLNWHPQYLGEWSEYHHGTLHSRSKLTKWKAIGLW